MKNKSQENVGQRLLTGAKFEKLFSFKANNEMREYAKRKGLQVGITGAEWSRRTLFQKGWEDELVALRKAQNGKAV